jgi:hypothetical protein
MRKLLVRALVVGACVSLAACATTSLESQTKTQVASQGRIYFLRPSVVVGMASAARLKINGQEVGAVGNGSFMYVDRDPGSYQLTTDVPLDFGESTINVPVRPGSVTYVEVRPNLGRAAAMALGGIAGGAIAAASSGEGKSGAFTLALMDQAAGAALLRELKK